jgi:hypothetical protein
MPGRLLRSALFALLLLAGVPRVHLGADADAALVKQVQAEVSVLRQGVFRVLAEKELETALRLTHRAIIEEVGGLDKARANATSPERKQAASLFKIEKVEFPEPPRFIAGTEHEFVIVPVAMTMTRADRKRNQSFNYYLGGRKKGEASWVYVDAAKLQRAKATAYFPDFPEGTELPPIFTRTVR